MKDAYKSSTVDEHKESYNLWITFTFKCITQICIILLLIRDANCYAWPSKYGVIEAHLKQLYDINPDSNITVKISKDKILNFYKKEKKEIAIASIDYGINQNSSIFFKTNLYKTQYILQNFLNNDPISKLNIIQQTVDFDIGGIMNIYKKDNAVCSLYLSSHPLISHINPKGNAFFSGDESSIDLGISYGISNAYSYIEFHAIQYIQLNNEMNNFQMGMTIGTKLDKNIQFAIKGSYASGYYGQLNPASEAYIKHYDKLFDVREQLTNLFMTYRKIPTFKLSVASEFKINDSTYTSLEIGGSISKNSMGNYISLDLKKTY